MRISEEIPLEISSISAERILGGIPGGILRRITTRITGINLSGIPRGAPREIWR